MDELGHRARADNYIGAARLAAGEENAPVLAELAKAEAVLVVADAISELAAAVKAASVAWPA